MEIQCRISIGGEIEEGGLGGDITEWYETDEYHGHPQVSNNVDTLSYFLYKIIIHSFWQYKQIQYSEGKHNFNEITSYNAMLDIIVIPRYDVWCMMYE